MSPTSPLQNRSLPPVPRDLRLADLRDVLRAGVNDFCAAPQYGLFFAATYVLAGLAMLQAGAGLFTWTLTMSLGFPLLAPFLAVGLYDVSRRLQRGTPLRFADVLGAVWQERRRQIPWAGAVLLVYFLFWSFVAHMLFALIMGPQVLLGPPDTLASYLNPAGLTLIAVEVVFGGLCAFLIFAFTVVALPMLLDREVDFVTAMRFSLAVTRANLPVLCVWAALIAGTTLLAMVPWFLGLLVVMPVLGHASWHLYIRVIG